MGVTLSIGERFPSSNEIVFSPSSTEEILLRPDAGSGGGGSAVITSVAVVRFGTTGFLAAATTAGIYQTESEQSSFLPLHRFFTDSDRNHFYGWEASGRRRCHPSWFVVVR